MAFQQDASPAVEPLVRDRLTQLAEELYRRLHTPNTTTLPDEYIRESLARRAADDILTITRTGALP